MREIQRFAEGSKEERKVTCSFRAEAARWTRRRKVGEEEEGPVGRGREEEEEALGLGLDGMAVRERSVGKKEREKGKGSALRRVGFQNIPSRSTRSSGLASGKRINIREETHQSWPTFQPSPDRTKL